MVEISPVQVKRLKKLARLRDAKAPITDVELLEGLEKLTEAVSSVVELSKQDRNIVLYDFDSEEVKGDKGDDGIDGKDGVDGKDGKDGTNGINGRDGVDGKNGNDGKDGRDGKDATEVDTDGIVFDVISQIPDITPESLRDNLELLRDDERLDIKSIKGGENLVDQPNLDRAISILDNRTRFLINKATPTGTGSGNVASINGDTASAQLLVAGSGVTITDNGSGSHTITSTASGVGTVTNVSSADANATVSTPTSTPVITIVSAPKLQTARTIAGHSFDGTANISITASDVGAPAGSGNSTGTNTGDQTITLIGDVTGTGAGSFSTTVTKVNGTSLAGLSTGILKNTTATGVPSIAIAADFPTLNQNTSGNAATVTTNANLTGVVTSIGNTTSIANGAITNAMLANGAVANLSGTNTGDQTNISGNAATVTTNANLTGDVTSIGNATTLTNAPVIAKVLTGYTSGAGTVSATDSILQAIQKLNGNDATNANLTGDVTSVGNATTLTNAPVIAKVLIGYTSGAGTVSATDSILQAIQKLNGNDATNANLTGVITSVGNATSIASQTGTGTTFVTQASPTFTGVPLTPQILYTDNAVTAVSNATTITRANRNNVVTNNSAATLTITLSTTSATAGDILLVQVLDFSAVAQTLAWVNTENSSVIIPALTNGSTTLPVTAQFKWNAQTSKWRCIGTA